MKLEMKTRLSASKEVVCNDASEDDNDDSVSVGTGSLADDSSRSETPTQVGQKKKKNKAKIVKSRLQYRCSTYFKEDHGQPIFSVQFNHHMTSDHPLVFCTAGSNRVSVYECEKSGEVKLLQSYVDRDSDENFYTCAWTFDDSDGHLLIAAAGCRGVIRLIDTTHMYCIKHFTGHGQSVNEVKVHPKDPNLLLSVSKDHTLRLWNLKTDLCIVVFGGVDGHRDEVLSCDIDLTGTQVVSCGMDHSVKIWQLNTTKINNAITASYQHNNRCFKAVAQHYPTFSTRDIHKNYVDCSQFLGRLILSKSCENRIVCWKPNRLQDVSNQLKLSDNTISILYQFDLRDCEIWFIRFSMDIRQKVLALGNQCGKVYVWDMDVDDPTQAKLTIVSHNKCVSAVRQTALSSDASVLLSVCDDGTVWRWDHRS